MTCSKLLWFLVSVTAQSSCGNLVETGPPNQCLFNSCLKTHDQGRTFVTTGEKWSHDCSLGPAALLVGKMPFLTLSWESCFSPIGEMQFYKVLPWSIFLRTGGTYGLALGPNAVFRKGLFSTVSCLYRLNKTACSSVPLYQKDWSSRPKPIGGIVGCIFLAYKESLQSSDLVLWCWSFQLNFFVSFERCSGC